MMTDLFNHFRRNIADRFELFIDGETHGDGGFQCAWTVARQYEVEGPYLTTDLARQRDAFGGEV